MKFTTSRRKKNKPPRDNGVCLRCCAAQGQTFKTNPSVCQLVGHLKKKYSRWCNFTNHLTTSINTGNSLSALTMKNQICVRARAGSAGIQVFHHLCHDWRWFAFPQNTDFEDQGSAVEPEQSGQRRSTQSQASALTRRIFWLARRIKMNNGCSSHWCSAVAS